MGRWAELARGIATLGFYLGGHSVLGVLLGLARTGAERTRRVIMAHSARAGRLAGIAVDVQGEEHVPPGPIVLVYNETSLADAMMNPEVLWRFTDLGVAAAEFGRVPFVRRNARLTGVTLFRRGQRSAADELLDMLTAAVAAGGRLAMAAEGRFSPDGKVGHFKRGAFLVAIRTGAPVVPCAVYGGRDILVPGSLRMRPGKLRYRIGAPIGTAGLTEDDAPALAERARLAVEAMYEAIRAQVT